MSQPIALSNRDDYQVLGPSESSVELGPERLAHVRELGFYVVFSPGAVGGVVVIEGAHRTGHTGTWDALRVVEWVGSDRAHYVAIPGVHLAVRVRVATAPVGGSVAVYAIGN